MHPEKDDDIVYSPYKYRETEGIKDVKSDLLRVDVVKVINETFSRVGMPVMTADELLDSVKDDPNVWALYANGWTMGLNQCEKPKTTERVMRFKPRNLVELAAFIAAIRPGAKSLVDGFVAREPHSYGIPAMDELLKLEGATGVTGESSYLFYDEQVMTLAKAAGISPADANALIKAIKKKKLEKVASYKERFIPGFITYLKEKQNVDDDLAVKTANDVWTVILNSASYLFNASHAVAMAIDSLYGAYLKLHFPYEFYTVMLKIYTEKGNKKKISQIIHEMKRYKNIQVTPGRFRQDNRDWYIDKENGIISQALTSIKFISIQAAQDLYDMRLEKFLSFAECLRYLQMETSVNIKQVKILIYLDYFREFGQSGKLLDVYNEFVKGKLKISKTLKSWESRLEQLAEYEKTVEDRRANILDIIRIENEMLEMPLSTDLGAPGNIYFIREVDVRFSTKVTIYNIRTGVTGTVRVAKKNYVEDVFKPGNFIALTDWKRRPKFGYSNGQRVALKDEYDIWLESCQKIA